MPLTSPAVADFIRAMTGRVFLIPQGTVIGHRWIDADGKPCSRYIDGARLVDRVVEQDTRVELQFDAGAIDACVEKALRAAGRRAKAGPVRIKVVR